MLTLVGEPADQAAADAKRVLELETKLASASLSREEMRDPARLYHPTELASFRTQLGAFDLDTYLHSVGTPSFSMLNVSTPGYFDALNKILPQTDLAIPASAPALGPAAQHTRHRAARSSRQRAVRLLRQDAARPAGAARRAGSAASGAVDGALGEALGRRLCRRSIPRARTRRARSAIMSDIEAAMGRDIQQLDWMSAADQDKGRREAQRTSPTRSAIPTSGATTPRLTITRGDALGNARARCSLRTPPRSSPRSASPSTSSEWDMTPADGQRLLRSADEQHQSSPPASCSRPSTIRTMGDAVNYGGTAAVDRPRAHARLRRRGPPVRRRRQPERLVDARQTNRNSRSAPTASSSEYDGFVAVDDVHVNGKLTLGENIADIGGVRHRLPGLAASSRAAGR